MLIRSEHYQRVEDYVNIEIPRTFSEDIPPKYHLLGFPTLKRTQIPLRPAAMGTYADNLPAPSENGLKLPQITTQKILATTKQIYFHQDKGDFPPPTKEQKTTDSMVTQPHQKTKGKM